MNYAGCPVADHTPDRPAAVAPPDRGSGPRPALRADGQVWRCAVAAGESTGPAPTRARWACSLGLLRHRAGLAYDRARPHAPADQTQTSNPTKPDGQRADTVGSFGPRSGRSGRAPWPAA